MYKNYFKRLFDILVALFALIIFSPIIVIVTIFLFFFNSGRPFFFQLRPGKDGYIFRVVKFRTMDDRKDADNILLPDAKRLTAIGKFMRRTSLDEIPQLLNVIKGDMSLVGPRPLLTEYLPLYDGHQRRRHEVRPGITGWAQVNGRNAISWKQKFDYDVWYVDHCNFGLDLKIIGMTIRKVIRREGVNSATAATMEKFTGN